MTKMFDNVNSYRPKEEEFPMKKQLLLFGLGWMGFRIFASLLEIFVILGFMAADPDVVIKEIFSDVKMSMILNSSVYCVMLGVLLFVSNSDTKKLMNSFTKWGAYLAGVIGFLAMLGFTNVYNTLLDLLEIGVTDNGNETTVVSVVEAYPIISLLVIGIIAPICEELTYRVGLFGALARKSKVLAYCVAVSVFALIHFTLDPSNIINELLNIPYYLFAGFVLTYLYDRFGFAGSVTTHILNNSISQIVRMFNR